MWTLECRDSHCCRARSHAGTHDTHAATFLTAAKDRVATAVGSGAAQLAKSVSQRTSAQGAPPAAAPAASAAAGSVAGAAPAAADAPYERVPAGERQPSAIEQLVDEQHAKAVSLALQFMDSASGCVGWRPA